MITPSVTIGVVDTYVKLKKLNLLFSFTHDEIE